MTHTFTLNNKAVTGRELARELGVSSATLYRYAKIMDTNDGDKIDVALRGYSPTGGRKARTYLWEGVPRTLVYIAGVMGMAAGTLKQRIRTFGVDCCLCYFPGRIPNNARRKMNPRKGKVQTYKKPFAVKSKNVRKKPEDIKVGSWESENL